jgi:hypothetical protein
MYGVKAAVAALSSAMLMIYFVLLGQPAHDEMNRETTPSLNPEP